MQSSTIAMIFTHTVGEPAALCQSAKSSPYSVGGRSYLGLALAAVSILLDPAVGPATTEHRPQAAMEAAEVSYSRGGVWGP